MLRNTRVQMAAVLATGVLLGYLAASGRLKPLAPAGGARAQEGAQAGDNQVIVFEVLLPGNALLEIDAARTKETGGERRFRTPPLPLGGRYNYTLKARFGGKEVSRHIHLTHGGPTSLTSGPTSWPPVRPGPARRSWRTSLPAAPSPTSCSSWATTSAGCNRGVTIAA